MKEFIIGSVCTPEGKLTPQIEATSGTSLRRCLSKKWTEVVLGYFLVKDNIFVQIKPTR